jgi:hypothetical protein
MIDQPAIEPAGAAMRPEYIYLYIYIYIYIHIFIQCKQLERHMRAPE